MNNAESDFIELSNLITKTKGEKEDENVYNQKADENT